MWRTLRPSRGLPMSPASRSPQRGPEATGSAAPLILIAEDDVSSREIYAMYFLAQGLRVQTAPDDGDLALERALASRPDAVVMDLAMPGVDGWEATRRLKADPRTARIPITACTAHGFGPAVERVLIAGCDAYVVKPCLPE